MEQAEAGAILRAVRKSARLSLQALANRIHFSQGYLANVESGKRRATVDVVEAYMRELGNDPERREALGKLLDRASAQTALQPVPDASAAKWTHVEAPDLDGIEAIELIRRVEASDAGPKTLEAIRDGVDRLCRAYTHTPPAELLTGCTAYQRYIAKLLDGKATLAQRRELMNLGGWLSLLTATANVDVGQARGAATNIEAARTLATETGDNALAGWIFETQAWEALTAGHHDGAVELCEAGLDVAPSDTSAQVQLRIQHARASAKQGDAPTTYRMLEDGAVALDRMPAPEHPEHHYVFDPRRLVAYSAGALVALADDDDLAEDYARRAVAQYDTGPANGRWVHRLALARVDLAMVLARSGQLTEAVHLGTQALGSWRIVASDSWLIDDLDRTLLSRYGDATEALDFHDTYRQAQHQLEAQLRALPSPED